MSELNNAEELVENIEYEVDDAQVVAVPIDPTLSISGEAADAKATGDAISGVIAKLKVNEKSPVQNEITLYASDILMSDATGAQTIAQTINGIGDKDASEIMYDADNLVSIADALDSIQETMDTELTEEQIDEIFNGVFGGDD